ncbi:MAG: rhodanese-like domain-containing protein [Bryobacteraceae bacterium]
MARRLLLALLTLALFLEEPRTRLLQGQTGTVDGGVPSDARISPRDLAALLSKSDHPRPTLIFVGYHPLFVGAHIKGAIFAGPGSKPEGIDQLKAVVRNIPRAHAVVVYCGCCPFDRCPNVQPSYKALREMGFTHVSVLHIPTNLHTDWVEKGYPTTRGAGY